MCTRFCEHKNREILNNEIEKWYSGVLRYKEMQDAYLYDFSNEDRLGTLDSENAFLAYMIWWEMAKRIWPECKLNIDQSDDYRGNRIKFIFNSSETKWFYSDVMHNAIVNKKNNKKLATMLGNESRERCEWKKIYHTIGNFVLIPDNAPQRQINLIHRDNNEWWDLVLQYLKDNYSWDNNIKIQEYICLTLQQMYLDHIFSSLYEEFCMVGFEKLKERHVWDQEIDSWNKSILEMKTSEMKFISFQEDEPIEAAKKIFFLIQLRGYIIWFLLPNK